MTPREEWRLPTVNVGRRVLVYDEVDSTSTQAALLADDPRNAGTAILAGAQTLGRGQYGRTWLAQPGTGVLMSLLLFPPTALRRPALLTAWAAVSVCELILQATGLEAKIKWPNDILVHGRKVCGILIEQGRGTVVGIGLNVNQSAESFVDAGLLEAGSLAVFSGRGFDVAGIARQLIAQLDEQYTRLDQGDRAGLEASWRQRLGLLGRNVSVECADSLYKGRLLDVSFDGIEVELPTLERFRVVPELVRHLTSASPSRDAGDDLQ